MSIPANDRNAPNAEQVRYWNEVSGPKWVALQNVIDAQIGPLGRLAMERFETAPGAHVLDVGCGCGSTSLEIATDFVAAGRVLGVDLSAVMLERARAAARQRGIGNVDFAHADAQTHRFREREFDALYSRFGVMFFADPTAAFANLRGGLRPQGRMSFVCWQSLRVNPWMMVPLVAVAEHVALPEPPPPGAPGPFAFADIDRVRTILAAAGFAGIGFESIERELLVGAGLDVDACVEFIMQMGPAATALREADPSVLPRVRAALRRAVEPHHAGDGLRMPGAAWLVTARAPGTS